jgi:hypothetical protein
MGQPNNAEWHTKKAGIMKRDSFCCKRCGNARNNLNIYHLFYIYGYNKWDLPETAYTTLCETCAERRGSINSYYLEDKFPHSSNKNIHLELNAKKKERQENIWMIILSPVLIFFIPLGIVGCIFFELCLIFLPALIVATLIKCFDLYYIWDIKEVRVIAFFGLIFSLFIMNKITKKFRNDIKQKYFPFN